MSITRPDVDPPVVPDVVPEVVLPEVVLPPVVPEVVLNGGGLPEVEEVVVLLLTHTPLTHCTNGGHVDFCWHVPPLQKPSRQLAGTAR